MNLWRAAALALTLFAFGAEASDAPRRRARRQPEPREPARPGRESPKGKKGGTARPTDPKASGPLIGTMIGATAPRGTRKNVRRHKPRGGVHRNPAAGADQRAAEKHQEAPRQGAIKPSR